MSVGSRFLENGTSLCRGARHQLFQPGRVALIGERHRHDVRLGMNRRATHAGRRICRRTIPTWKAGCWSTRRIAPDRTAGECGRMTGAASINAWRSITMHSRSLWSHRPWRASPQRCCRQRPPPPSGHADIRRARQAAALPSRGDLVANTRRTTDTGGRAQLPSCCWSRSSLYASISCAKNTCWCGWGRAERSGAPFSTSRARLPGYLPSRMRRR